MATDFYKLWFWPWEAAQMNIKLVETLMASQSVIAARLPMIGAAMSDPINANYRELSRMVTEKGQAFGRSGRSVSSAMETVRRSSQANARDLGRLSGSGLLTPADWSQKTERRMAPVMHWTSLPAESLAPVHKRATANARRLKSPRKR